MNFSFTNLDRIYVVFILIIIIIIIIIIMIINSLRPGKYWVDVQQGIVLSHGGGSSLALVGNPSRNVVSIKILVWRYLKPNP